MTRMIKLANWSAIACLATAGVVGCQNNATTKPSETANGVRSDVTDIRPMESAQLAYQPVAFQPPAPRANAPPEATTPAAPAVAGNAHVVKHGETLYSIAKSSYGDG